MGDTAGFYAVLSLTGEAPADSEHLMTLSIIVRGQCHGRVLCNLNCQKLFEGFYRLKVGTGLLSASRDFLTR